MSGTLNPLKWTPRQLDVLRLLAGADAPMYGAEIAERVGVTDKDVYNTLTRLRAWHLIAEVNGPGGQPLTQRRRYFEITRSGRREAAKRCGTDVPRETKEN